VFEPIDLTPDRIMQRAGVPMLYDSASNPRLTCLYICPVANVPGRAPLIPCFIGGNSHPTIPYRFKDYRRIGHASADTQRDRGNGSRLYLRGEHLDVALWPGPPPDGVHRRSREDQGRAAQREQDQGRDEEASQRGRCRPGPDGSEGGRRPVMRWRDPGTGAGIRTAGEGSRLARLDVGRAGPSRRLDEGRPGLTILWAGARSPLWRRRGPESGSASGGPGGAVEGARPGRGPGW
jgi:hypothetical protein